MEKETSFAQAAQDLFAFLVNRRKSFGTFVDIGAGDPVIGSNTFLLEKKCGWLGIAAEKDPELIGKWSTRSASLYHDAFDAGVIEGIERLCAKSGRIDFLSLDLEPPELAVEFLTRIPFDRVRFTSMCVEHDAYRTFGWERKKQITDILDGHGYVCVCDNVLMLAVGGNGFQLVPVEDWWVDPLEVDLNFASNIASELRRATESRLLSLIGRDEQ